MPNQNVPNLKELPENDPIDFDDSLIGFHTQAGLVDKSWILFDSGACANCCPEWFAPDYPTLPLNESAPSLRSLSGKTLDVQGRKIVQLDCGNGHSLSVQFYVCTGIPFPLVSVARLLLQDFWTVMAKEYMALISPDWQSRANCETGNTGVLDTDCAPIWYRQCGKIGGNVFARGNVGD